MLKLKLLCSIVLFVGTTLIGQEEFEGSIRWGEPMKLKRKESSPTPIGSTESSFYSRKRVKKTQLVQKYSLESLALVKENELDLTYKGFDLNIVNDFIFADKVVFITYYIDKKAKEKHYLIHELLKDSKLGNTIELAVTEWSKKKIVLTQKALKKLKSSSAYSFEYIVSDDFESMLVSYQNNDGDTETVLFNKDIEEVERTKMEIPFENFKRTSARLSNSGRLFMLGHEFTIEETSGLVKREIEKRGDYHVLIHDAVTGDMENEKLDINKHIYESSLKILPDESVVVYGMYTNQTAKGVSGAFFQKLNSSLDVTFTSLEEFEESFITQFWTARQKKKAEKKKKKKNPKKKAEPSLYSYIMHDLVIKENGDMVMLGEQYYMYVTSRTYTDANGNSHTTYTYHYIYNDIIAVNCTKDGEITWKEKVKKRQHSTNDGGYYSSFYTITQENNVYLMYNDKEGNMDDAEEATSSKEKRELKRDNVAALITFGEEGETTRTTLFDYEGEESRNIVPKRCMKMGEKEIFLFAEMGKRTKILGWMNL